jgi:hypothetical protein
LARCDSRGDDWLVVVAAAANLVFLAGFGDDAAAVF